MSRTAKGSFYDPFVHRTLFIPTSDRFPVAKVRHLVAMVLIASSQEAKHNGCRGAQKFKIGALFLDRFVKMTRED